MLKLLAIPFSDGPRLVRPLAAGRGVQPLVSAGGHAWGPAGVSGRWVWGRLGPMLEDAQERRAPAFTAALAALLNSNNLIGVLVSGLVSCAN